MTEPNEIDQVAFDAPAAAARRVIKEAVRDVFGKVTEYKALFNQQVLIKVNKTSLTEKNEIEEAHDEFIESLNGTGWKLDSMIVDDPKYLEFGPLNVMIFATYGGNAGLSPAA